MEFQAAWNKWLPETYSMVDIEAEILHLPGTPSSGAVAAFSGGVDATFSIWRHTQSLWKQRSQKVVLSSLIHGFDIPLTDSDAFQAAFDRAKQTLDDLDVPLIPIKTNLRSLLKAEWEHAFSCALVAALGNLKQTAGTCIIGSSEPYDSLVIPWGSSPVTDHLLSSDEFLVIHDGASHSRTEKVGELAAWPTGADNLRVCWEGRYEDKNCGVCEKCVRTRLNFLASNNTIPNCFPKTDIQSDLKKININNDAVYEEWQQIYQHAMKNNIASPWVYSLKRKLAFLKLIDGILPKNSKRRLMIKRLLGRKEYGAKI